MKIPLIPTLVFKLPRLSLGRRSTIRVFLIATIAGLVAPATTSATPLTISSADVNVTLPDFFLPQVGYLMSGGVAVNAGDDPAFFSTWVPLAPGSSFADHRSFGAIDATSTGTMTTNPDGSASVHLFAGGEISSAPATHWASFISVGDAWLKAASVPLDGFYDFTLSYSLAAAIPSLSGHQSFAQIQASLFGPAGMIALPVHNESISLSSQSSAGSSASGGFDQQVYLKAGESYSLRLQVTSQQYVDVDDTGSILAMAGGAVMMLLLRRRAAG